MVTPPEKKEQSQKAIRFRQSEFDFHIEEYKALRTEICDRLKSVEQMERFALLAIAAFYGWILTKGVTNPPDGVRSYVNFAWWLPCAIAIVVGLRSSYYLNKIIVIGHYIKGIESGYGNKLIGGWEHHLFTARDNNEYVSDRLSAVHAITKNGWTLIFWGAISIVTGTLAFLVNQPA